MKIFSFAGFDLGEQVSGRSSHVEGIARGFHKIGWDVTLFSFNESHDKHRPSFPFSHVLVKKTKGSFFAPIITQLKLAWKLFRWKGPKPDVMYLRNGITMLIPVTLYANYHKIPLFYEVNGLIEWELSRRVVLSLAIKIENWVLKHSQGVFCVTEMIGQHLIERTKLPEEKFVTMPNGADENVCCTQNLPMCPKNDSLTIGFLGAFQPWQGVEKVLQILPQIKNRFSDVKFVIAGSGAQEKKYRAIVDELGLSEIVTFPGFINKEKIGQVITEFDVAIAPYWPTYPGSPLKIYTYLLCQRIVIASDLPTMRLFRECEAVLFAEGYEPQDYADAIIKVLEIPPEQRAELGIRGKEFVLNNYTWDHVAKRTADCIIDFCKKG
ncbi:MAG: glycosyltransferase family 4 protein [Phycisphaerae bacterium]|nr:glycosyltransferase family 4 protein [Phycisphaerae bacterium]